MEAVNAAAAARPAGAEVARNLDAIRARITAAGGDPERVAIVAVTKGFDARAVRAALDAGLVDIGENYAQELIAKAASLSRPSSATRIRWHFLGAVQRNKVPALAPLVAIWQAVDRPAAGEAIAQRAPGAQVLVEVNISGEDAKHGCGLADAPKLVARLRALELRVLGLMAIGPSGPPGLARPGFHALARLAEDLALPELSIGMTGDLEVAIEEGATIVRIGRGLFGPRPGTRDL